MAGITPDPPPRWLVMLIVLLLIFLMIEIADAKRWIEVYQELFGHAQT